MADNQNGNEDDWEYASEEGDDYSWEYEDSEEEAAEEVKQKEAEKKGVEATVKDVKDHPKEENIRRRGEEINENVDKEVKPEEITRRRRREVNEEENDEEIISDEIPRRRRRDVKEEEKKDEEVTPMGKSDRNAIMEQMKRLQEGYNNIDVDLGDSDYSLSDKSDDDEDVKPKKAEEEEIDLEDMDLLDPFGSEPVPVIPKSKAPQNGHGKEESKKKHRKQHKKSRHSEKIDKFKKLEEKDGDDKDEEYRTKKIHVRSKDPMKIARQFEKSNKTKSSSRDVRKAGPKPPPVEINKICKVCGKEPYLVERLVAEKSWWCKNCFRCKECNKLLTLDTYASHQGVIYCKPHHKDLFKPKAVINDLTDEIIKKNIDFSCYDVDETVNERHKRQEKRMETIVRENKPVDLPGVVKSQVDDSKWEGLEKLDVGSKFMMFEKAVEEKESHQTSDRYGIMEKLKRLQEGEDVSDLLAEIDDEMPSEEEEEYDPDDLGLTEVQKKAHHADKLFNEETKKEKLAEQRKKEIKKLRDKLMAGTRESVLDSFDELNHRKITKTKVDVRSENAKKFMNMFNKGEVPEGVSASERTTMEKEAELEIMRSKKRGERDFFKKMENGEVENEGPKEPKLLIGKLKTNGIGESTENGDQESTTLSKKFSFFENYDEESDKKQEPKADGRNHDVKECKASSVLNKFKDMENRVANGEDPEEHVRSRPLKRFTPPRKLGEESGSDYSDSDYSDSEYSDSEDYSSDSYLSGEGGEENEYLRNVRDAARAKQLTAKFEKWEASLGEDGGYTNLVDEDGRPLETASKLKNRFEQLAVEEPTPKRGPAKKFQVKRFKPKEAYDYQD